MTHVLSKGEVCKVYDSPSWQRMLFSEFESTLTSKSRPFPCIFGVTGMKSDQLRYVFLDAIEADVLAPALRSYLSVARDIGRMTSLVVFARPGPVQGIEAYRARFWSILDELERIDGAPRPAGVSRRLDTPSWEFCFAGEPIFVVCNSPAHVLRQSRRSTSFMITFQPRWVFEGLTDSDDPAVLKSLRTVRERLASFDAIETSPHLGTYGDPKTREFRQYFIDDTNEVPVCPFHSLGRKDAEDDIDQGEGKVA
ncbi:MAG: YqcI/YcgG family protein [Pseudomonadota bacterium]